MILFLFIIGGIFNKILVHEYEDIKTHVGRYFETNQPNVHIYGFIPIAASLLGKDEDTQGNALLLKKRERERESRQRSKEDVIKNTDCIYISMRPFATKSAVKGACQRVTPATLAMSEEEREQCGKAIDNFIEHVDLERLSQDLFVSSS